MYYAPPRCIHHSGQHQMTLNLQHGIPENPSATRSFPLMVSHVDKKVGEIVAKVKKPRTLR